MFRVSLFPVIICVIVCLNGPVRVSTEELPTDINVEGSISDGQTGDTSIAVNQGLETLIGQSPDVHIPLKEPYPQIIDGTEVVLSTPTTSNLHAVTLVAGVPLATEPEIEDIRMEPTVASVESSSHSSQTDVLPETEAQHSGIEMDLVEKGNPHNGVLESSHVTLKGETVMNTEADKMLSEAMNTESVTSSHLPDINQILEQIQHTRINAMDSVDSMPVSDQLPASEGSSYTFHVPMPTQALRLNIPGTSEPTVVGQVTVDPQVVDDVLVPTQFSLEDDDEKHNNGEEEFPTFDKWSMQYLAEQEKQNNEKKQEQSINPSTLLLQKKLRQNYAAASCGAKVIASNPEAENVKYLLNRNPDEYMISPCKAKKWFVVELCEPLQIHKVELGSLEMFSSPPKSFRVFASQRYPSKEWLPLGKYDMVPERSIQSFTSQPSQEFVKFVRVELLEHYGDEHYCPVSTFRVMGVDMTSDDEDETVNEAEETDEETFGEIEDEDIEESVNLFTSAKEIVLKLVKKVLYKEDQQQQEEEGKPLAADNITVKGEEKKAKKAPCSHQGLPSHADIPTVHIPEAGIISPPSDPKVPEEIAIVTKLDDTEQLPTVTFETPVVIKLGEDADARHWDFGVYDTPDYCVYVDWNKFLQIMAYAHMLSTTCPSRPQAVREDKKLLLVKNQTDGVSENVTPSQAVASEDGDIEHESIPADTSQADTDDRSVPGIKELDQRTFNQAENRQGSGSSSQDDDKVVPTTGLQQKHSSEATFFTSSGVSVTKSEDLEPSSLFTQPDVDAVTLSLMTPDLDLHQSQVVEQGAANLAETIFLKVSPSPTLTSEDSLGADEDMQLEAPTAEHRTDLKVDEYTTQPSSDSSPTQGSEGQDLEDVAEQTKGQMLEKNETSSSSGKTGKSVDLVKVGLSSSSKRDTSIMKLSSRIMALEQNVSMAKKYLEELSRAFKQQNDDMMKLLNKTEKKLNVYVSQSEERELRQQTQADVLEQKVINLSQVVDSMQLQMNALGKELRDAQFLLACFQAVLFLWLMITSVRGRSKSPLVYTDHQFLLDTMPTKPTFERSEKGNLHRRNSDVGVQSGLQPTMAALKRQVSEANLASIGNKQAHYFDDQTTFVPDTTQVPKKRKKKKLKQQQFSVDSVSSLSATSNTGSPPAQSSSFSSYAGVLFGTDSSYRPAQNIHVKSSTSQAMISGRENHNMSSGCKLTSCEVGCAHLGCPCAVVASDCLQAPGTSSSVRMQETGHSVSSSSLMAPTFHTILAPSESGFVSGTDRIPSVHFLEHHRICDLPGALWPQTCVAGTVLSQSTSPAFHVPVYHRNKMRTLIDNKSNNHSDSASIKSTGVAGADKMIKRRSSVGFINPQVGGDFFLAENYMCENRFKFPSSLPLLESESSSKRTAFVNDGTASDGKYPALMSCELKQFQPNSWTLSKQSAHHKSTSALSAISFDPSPSGISSSKSLPDTPSFIPLHNNTSQMPFISVPYNPQSLSQLSSTSLTEQRTDYRQPPHPPYHYATHTHDVGVTVPYEIKTIENVAKCDTNVSSVMTGLEAVVDGVNKSAGTSQGSLPLHCLRPSKCSHKVPHSRQAAFQDYKLHTKYGLASLQGKSNPASLQGKSSSASLQGKSSSASLQSSSKVKKMSSLSKKNTGSSVSSIDSSTNLTASQKGSI